LRLTQSLGNTQKTAAKPQAKPVEKKKNGVAELPSISSLVPGFFMPPASIHGEGNGSGNNGSNGSGSLGLGDTGENSGNQNSNNSGSATSGRLVSDESAKAKDPNASDDNSGNKKQLPPIAPPATPQTAGGASVRGNTQKFNLWWPVCAFVDSNVSDGTANTALKGMVDHAAKCNVKIEVFPIKVDSSSWRDDPDMINKATVAKCNLPKGLAGSATALVNPAWPKTAAKMCDSFKEKKGGPDMRDGVEGEWETSVAGCAQLRSGTSKQKPEDQAKMDQGHKHGSSAAKGDVAPSIEVASGHNAFVVSHEALGHSQMGKPNGSVHGMGIGEPSDFDFEKGGKGEGTSEGWSGSGCGVMREKAHSNSVWSEYFGGSPPEYDSSRQTYYRPGQKLYNIQGDPALFSPPNPVPPPGPISTPMIAQTVPGVSQSQGQASNLSADFFNQGDGKIYGNSVPEAKTAAASPEKHKEGQTKIPTAAKAAPKSQPKLIGESQPVQEPRADVNVAITPPAGGELAKKGNKVVWAEGAKAVDPKDFAGKGNADVSSDNVYNSSSSSTSVASGSSTKGGSILYDDSATVNPYAGSEDSGPAAKPAGSAPNSYSDSNSLAYGGGYGGSGGNSSSGGKVGAGSGFDSGVFNGLGEEETEEEAAARRKKSGATTERNGRRPASGSESRGVRVSKPTYGESE